MLKYFFTIISIWALCGVKAQEFSSLTGRLTQKNGSAASHITISVEGTNLGAVTDHKGRYEIKNVPYGRIYLVITAIDINTHRQEVNVDSPTKSVNIVVTGKSETNIEEVAVERKTVKKDMETSGFAVAVIETKEASLRNLTTNELLDRAVGVRVRQNGGIGSQIEYNLNGMSGSAVGIFLDGTPISTFGQSFNLNNIPPAMIERIEVYKGVLPSHLTGDYVGGAINVIMRKDASANNIAAAVSYGSFNTFQSDVAALYRNQKSGFTTRLSGAYIYTDNSYEMWGKFAMMTDAQQRLTRYNRFKRFNNTYKSISGRFEFGFTDVKWADQFFVGYNISDTYQDIPHGITMAQPYVGRFNEYQAHVFSLNYIKNNFLLAGLALNVNAVYSKRSTYLQDTARTMYNWDGNPMTIIRNGVVVPLVRPVGRGQQGAAVITNIDRDIINSRTNLSYMVAQGHRLSVNHNLNSTRRQDEDLLNPSAPMNSQNQRNTTTNIFGFNYEAQTLNNKLKTNVLAKYTINQNHYDNAGTTTTLTNRNPGYGFTASYNVIPKLYVIASMENSFISPRDEQIFGSPETNIVENLELKPERNVNYNAGFRYEALSDDKNRLSLYASAFWRNGYDKIAAEAVDSVIVGRESDANLQTTRFINIGRTQSRGFEAEVTYVYANRLNLLVNLSRFNTLMKTEFDENGNPHRFFNRQLPNEPYFMVNGSVQYRLDNLIQKKSTVNLFYNTGYVAPFTTVWFDSEDWFRTPTQFYHDVGASYRTPNGKLIVSLDVKNITNGEVYDNFGVQKPGRGYYLKLNYMLNNFTK
ncbi:TonB-dependent receptor [Sphingobacterium corticibacter]|uniref:TonB-dependent receptor n=1 Tax=Sphingobacterium corticibacter TaxID=2171749 RepID=A0A2T8HFK5_9SPHI|nr:TonB-dependent receptor plug domain-containing protein [Sphingobacterium corticibacter]PVH24221.1 TonB-dependent receptor [Sphingobacterium corticibacter]